MLKSFIRTSVWSLVIVFALTKPVSAQQSNKRSTEADRATETANVKFSSGRADEGTQ